MKCYWKSHLSQKPKLEKENCYENYVLLSYKRKCYFTQNYVPSRRDEHIGLYLDQFVVAILWVLEIRDSIDFQL